MTDEELVDAMLDKAHFHGELNDAREPVWLRAAILKALKDARQPTAHEVPGFHVLDLSGQGVNHD